MISLILLNENDETFLIKQLIKNGINKTIFYKLQKY